ncbi:hypothetical protein [Sphingomonas sp. CFBP 8760]|uniref:hypothetical protein n=1 Tax=Sphingomonas sp. CFBP 8760 TaxID=2775282 RepID=UPI00177C244B|nr:hypothetical protein [Sphingomonas sp. CFBP 8760]MBD8547904.1 hypothetical protein [Sphingomonas sp. CFBP 8760]
MTILDFELPSPNGDVKNFPEVAADIAGFVKAIQRFVRLWHYQSGSLGAMPIAFAGNSFAGYGFLANSGAYIAQAMMLHYDADIIIDDRPYYWNLVAGETDGATGYKATENYPRIADPNLRGLNFGAGGRNTDQMYDYQLKYILECDDAGKMAPVIFFDPWVNDNTEQVGSGKRTVDRMISICKPILARGIHMVVIGNGPRQGIGTATENAYTKNYVEQRFQQWAEKTPGMHFIPVLDLLKDTDPAGEPAGNLNWRTQTDGVVTNSATNDGIHYSVYGARQVAKRIADVLAKIVREFVPPVFDLTEYDEDRNPFGNYYGPAGRLVGSGGKINGVAAPVVSKERLAQGNVRDNMPTNVELIYTPTGTFKVTPILTGNPDEPLWLEFSGTPTNDTHIVVRLMSNRNRKTTKWWYVYGDATWENGNHVAGIALGDASLNPPPNIPQVSIRGIGGSGGRHNVMPYVLNEDVKLRGRGNFIGAGGNWVPMDLQTGACANIETTGRLRVRRLGMFTRENNPYQVAA